MVLTTLIENLVYQKGLIAEHGLSFYLETGNLKIVFDTGQGENFIHNSRKMGIDLSQADYLIISHGHYDHIGGLHHFLEINQKAKILLKPQALSSKFQNEQFIGLEQIKELPPSRLEYITSVRHLDYHIFVMPDIKNYFPVDSHKDGFFIQENNEIIPDPFDDELFLSISSNQKITIISSCSHNGITNIIETAKNYFHLPVQTVIGGFHTRKSSDDVLGHIAEYFNTNTINKVGVCHCTGVENFSHLKKAFRAEIFYNYTGTKISIT